MFDVKLIEPDRMVYSSSRNITLFSTKTLLGTWKSGKLDNYD